MFIFTPRGRMLVEDYGERGIANDQERENVKRKGRKKATKNGKKRKRN